MTILYHSLLYKEYKFDTCVQIFRYESMVYPKDYGLPKVNKFPNNTQNVSNCFEPSATNSNKAFKVNYPNSKNYFKPIIINSSPFRRSNAKINNDRKCMSREGTFLDQTPIQESDVQILQNYLIRKEIILM